MFLNDRHHSGRITSSQADLHMYSSLLGIVLILHEWPSERAPEQTDFRLVVG